MVTGVMSSKYLPDRSRGLTVAKVGVTGEKEWWHSQLGLSTELEGSRAEYLLF